MSITPGSRLRALRIDAELSQERLAARSAVSVRTIRALECDGIAHPRHSTLHALAECLGLGPEEVAGFVAGWYPPTTVRSGELAELVRHSHEVGEFVAALPAQVSRMRTVASSNEMQIDDRGIIVSRHFVRGIEALQDGLDRFAHVVSVEPRGAIADMVRFDVIRNCLLSRTVVLDSSTIGAEYRLDRPLALGARSTLELRADFRAASRPDAPPEARETEALTVILPGVVRLVEQVRFTPPAVPRAVWRVTLPAVGQPATRHEQIPIEANGAVQAVVESPTSGVHGLQWVWN